MADHSFVERPDRSALHLGGTVFVEDIYGQLVSRTIDWVQLGDGVYRANENQFD